MFSNASALMFWFFAYATCSVLILTFLLSAQQEQNLCFKYLQNLHYMDGNVIVIRVWYFSRLVSSIETLKLIQK